MNTETMQMNQRKLPDPIDVHVGQRMRVRRKMLNMTQTELGKALGVTFQQVQKYERGTNRIGCSRLFHMGVALDVEISYFFEGAETKLPGYVKTTPDVLGSTIIETQETQELLAAYYKIADPRIRKKVLGLAKLLCPNMDI